jgi:hypothetical protein
MRTSCHRNSRRRLITLQHVPDRCGIRKLGELVAALPLLRFVGPVVLDELWVAGTLLTELQTPTRNVEVRVALAQQPLILGSQGSAGLERLLG